MTGQKITDSLKKENAALEKVKAATGHASIPMIDKIIRKSKSDIKAIESLGEDQQEYLKRNAKEYLAARKKKKVKRLHK
jgi:DNA-directed RNA polymerase alpha subunit